MKALLWKDYHVSRPIFIFGTVLMLVPYLIVGIAELVSWRRDGGSVRWIPALMYCAFASLGLSILTIAAIAGNAFAGERVDRSAEFLGCLPVSHARIVLSKLSVALAAALALWLVNLAVWYGLAPLAEVWPKPAADILLLAAITGLTFGSGWLASAMLNSAAISVGLALAAPATLGAVLGIIADLSTRPWADGFHTAYLVLCVVLGLAALALGSLYYVRRVEP